MSRSHDSTDPDATTTDRPVSAEDVVLAGDLPTARDRLAALLEGEHAHVEDLDDTQFPHNKGRKKIAVDGGTDLFFKSLRNEGHDAAKDLYCEYVTTTFAEELNMATPSQQLVEHEDHGAALVSRLLEGENGATAQDCSRPANDRRLRATYAFELWVLNYDDKANHFWTIDSDDGREVYVVDHGHALHRGNLAIDVDEVYKYRQLNDRYGTNPEFYGVSTLADVQHAVGAITSVTNDQIEAVIDEVIGEIKALSTGYADVEAFLADEEEHRRAAETILKTRRHQLPRLVDYRLD